LRHRAEKQTDTQTNGGKNRTPATAVCVHGKESSYCFRRKRSLIYVCIEASLQKAISPTVALATTWRFLCPHPTIKALAMINRRALLACKRQPVDSNKRSIDWNWRWVGR